LLRDFHPAAVLLQLRVEEVLRDGGQLSGQLLVEERDDLFVTLHGSGSCQMSGFGSHSRRGGLARTGQVRADCGDSGGRLRERRAGAAGLVLGLRESRLPARLGLAGRACGSRRDLGAAVDLASPSRQLSRFTHEPQLEPAPVALRMSLTLRAPSAIPR